MAASLILCLASVGVLYFLLGADFVGATQLMVYVGGTVVLLIFGIMLTSSSPTQQLRTSPADGFLSAGIGVLFLAIVAFTIGAVDWAANAEKLRSPEAVPVAGQQAEDLTHGNTTRPLALALMGVRPDRSKADGYLLPFEIVSVHLLVVLIGAAYLARTKRRAVEAQ
jgi:NADH:ubiquinone oxidoreductase subunit 6 (subunit J)